MDSPHPDEPAVSPLTCRATSGSEAPRDPHLLAAFHRVQLLLGAYLGLSLLAVAATVVLHNHPSVVNDAVWTRGGIVIAGAGLMLDFARRAARGSRASYRRLRLLSAILTIEIVILIARPIPFPLWMKLEQGTCGLLLIALIAVVNAKKVRTSFNRP